MIIPVYTVRNNVFRRRRDTVNIPDSILFTNDIVINLK